MLESFGLCRWADGLRHSTVLSPNEARKGEREREFKHHLSSQEVMHAYVWVWGGGRAGALVESLREI